MAYMIPMCVCVAFFGYFLEIFSNFVVLSRNLSILLTPHIIKIQNSLPKLISLTRFKPILALFFFIIMIFIFFLQFRCWPSFFLSKCFVWCKPDFLYLHSPTFICNEMICFTHIHLFLLNEFD